ncbi:degenerin-like protein asic-2 [Mytilus galloprovincialis]|uniref:degenerin-like protein asic-2 n=1 Tax=Mytilus galloprovincialis TaxID=29158 RepID=UPI003F7BCD34
MLVSKLKEFSGYTSIHGIGRFGDATYILQKIFWTCICLGSFSMCVFQIYRLIGQYTSESVNTQISTTYSKLDFPSITFCNLNPLSYNKVKKVAAFYQIVNETAKALKVDPTFFDDAIQPTTDQHTENYTTGTDPLTTANQVLHLRMGDYADTDIHGYNVPQNEFIVKCSYQSRNCSSSEIQKVRDEYYGTCYKFTPSSNPTNLAGPAYGLELLLDVQQHDYIPFVTATAGVRLAIHSSQYKAQLKSEGISVSTKFETNIAMRQERFIRYAGSEELCDSNNTYSSVLPCMERCTGIAVRKECKCLSSYDFLSLAVSTMCKTTLEIECMATTEALSGSELNCKCKMPCRQTSFKKNIFMTQYPAENYAVVLNTVMETNDSRESISDSLSYVKIFFSSLVEDVIQEDLAYTDENFVSDIGGQLGLWAGFSVLSLAELLELIVILFHACCSRKKAEVNAAYDEKE